MGILLLTDSVRRLDWWGRLVVSGALAGSSSHHAFRFWLAAVAAMVRDPLATGRGVEPVDALFGGALGEVSRADLDRFFTSTNPVVLQPIGIHAPDWHGAALQAADALLGEFRSRIRGYQRSTLRFVRERLVACPGRASLDANRLVVTLEPGPWSAALHVSGADDPVSPPWHEPRHVVFQLEGL
jgi:hypothetical protein